MTPKQEKLLVEKVIRPMVKRAIKEDTKQNAQKQIFTSLEKLSTVIDTQVTKLSQLGFGDYDTIMTGLIKRLQARS